MLMTRTTPGTFPCITVLSLRGSWWRTWCSSPRYLDTTGGWDQFQKDKAALEKRFTVELRLRGVVMRSPGTD